jgi:hypothetical protein
MEMTVARVPDERFRFSQAERIGAATAPAARRPPERGEDQPDRAAERDGQDEDDDLETDEGGQQPGRVSRTDKLGGQPVDDERDDEGHQCPGERDRRELHHLTVEPGDVGQRERLEDSNRPQPVERLAGQSHDQADEGDGPYHRSEAGDPHTFPGLPDHVPNGLALGQWVRWKCSSGMTTSSTTASSNRPTPEAATGTPSPSSPRGQRRVAPRGSAPG